MIEQFFKDLEKELDAEAILLITFQRTSRMFDVLTGWMIGKGEPMPTEDAVEQLTDVAIGRYGDERQQAEYEESKMRVKDIEAHLDDLLQDYEVNELLEKILTSEPFAEFIDKDVQLVREVAQTHLTE